MQDFLLNTNLTAETILLPDNSLLTRSVYEMQFANGDWLIDNSDEQHQLLLLICNKGDFKEFPDRCVGISTWLKDDEEGAMLGEIKKEFERDGMQVNLVQVLNDKLNINAGY